MLHRTEHIQQLHLDHVICEGLLFLLRCHYLVREWARRDPSVLHAIVDLHKDTVAYLYHLSHSVNQKLCLRFVSILYLL